MEVYLPLVLERPCGDFRGLNDLTLQDAYQLPNINNFSSNIKKANFYSKVDWTRAFHFVPIRKCDQNKTCVPTPWGLFKFKRLAFGLKDAPLSFQKFLSEVLHGIPNIYIYLDDILIWSETLEEMEDTVEKVFKKLDEFGLSLALSKCKFAATEVEFLGYNISKLS